MRDDDDRVESLFRGWKDVVADLVRFGCSEEDARDIAQRALIATWQRLDTIAPGAERSYMQRTARNLAINEATRTRTGVPLDEVPAAMADRGPSPEAALIDRQETEQFRSRFDSAMAELPEETRHCVVLRSRGNSYKEIATTLGLSWMAVQSKLHRAAKHFRKRLGEPPSGINWLDLPGGNDDDHER